MKNLFSQADTAGILDRLEHLPPGAQRQWGKMSVDQMLAHCNASLETAMELNYPKKLPFFLRLIGGLMKPKFFSDKPFTKNAATDKLYIIEGSRDFEQEKAKVISRIKAFSEGGPSKCSTQPHVFFGKLSSAEWAIMQWKHFDHHLRQFGG